MHRTGEAISDWLISEGLGPVEIAALFDTCCARLQEAGLPLWRAHLGLRILHPLIAITSHVWHPGQGLHVAHGTRSNLSGGAWQQGPYHHLIRTGQRQLRAVVERGELPFPILEDLRPHGLTDYVAYQVPFGTRELDSVVGSWATDRPGGFTEQDIHILERVLPSLALVCKAAIKEQLAHNVLATYLGADAGVRVLQGQIQRGDCESIHAVVWYSDLRSSTPMADTLAAEEFLAVLNTYFECTAGAVLAEGGEVLLLLGDAVLAIFPIAPIRPTGPEQDGARSEAQACAAALRAVRAAEHRLRAVNAARADAGQPPLDFGVGLHVGDLMYGNIGVPERLQFTVVGPVANEVARIEGLTKSLGRRVLVSSRFAGNLPLAWEPLGAHLLRGVGQPVEIFALPRAERG